MSLFCARASQGRSWRQACEQMSRENRDASLCALQTRQVSAARAAPLTLFWRARRVGEFTSGIHHAGPAAAACTLERVRTCRLPAGHASQGTSGLSTLDYLHAPSNSTRIYALNRRNRNTTRCARCCQAWPPTKGAQPTSRRVMELVCRRCPPPPSRSLQNGLTYIPIVLTSCERVVCAHVPLRVTNVAHANDCSRMRSPPELKPPDLHLIFSKRKLPVSATPQGIKDAGRRL